MTHPELKSCLLIGSPVSESDDEFNACVNELLTDLYGKIPEWLQFIAGQRVAWRGVQFKEFICVAGSVCAQLMLRARRPGGIARVMITYGSTLDGKPFAEEIRDGVETPFDPDELQLL